MIFIPPIVHSHHHHHWTPVPLIFSVPLLLLVGYGWYTEWREKREIKRILDKYNIKP